MELELTADGSYTLYVPELNEHYHSVKGALTEAQHIFIDMALRHSHAESPRILEIGFGTGLNCLLTALEAQSTHCHIHYTGIEHYPLSLDVLQRLDYPNLVGNDSADLYYALHRAPWGEPTDITPHFTLLKIENDFTRYTFSPGFDIIYFDAFAPEKQPEMWTQRLFDHLFEVLNPGGILTTYCAKGVVRRMLQSAGFMVERLPGPPAGKREIIRATKP
ncbi:MAG: tRNA (5-methylaminomethyl-2-thiouridine)(34)-methyltransferase MnmD [Muribaculaceae bacterium]